MYGHGRSARLPSQDDTAVRIGTMIAKFLEQQVGRPALVSGHSSGALVHFERPDAYLDAFARLSARVP